jgi:hypothetical protein
MTGNSQISFTGVIGYCVAIATLQFLAVPLHMIGNSPSDFGFINFTVLLVAGGMLSCGLALLLLTFYGLLPLWGKAEMALLGLRFLFWWVLIAGFLLPVSISAGMVDAHLAGVHTQHLIITAVAALGQTWLSRTAARQFLLAFAIVFSLLTVSTSAYSVLRSDLIRPATSTEEKLPESTRLSAERNVLVISLDGLQGHIVANLLREESDIAREFKDFTIYENALSQSPATVASMVGELFGVRDYKALGNSLDEVKEELVNRGLADQIPLLYAEDAYQRGYPFGDDVQLGKNDVTATADSVEFLRYALARVATRYAVNSASEKVFTALVDLLVEEGSDKLAGRMRNHVGPDWDKQLAADIHQFDSFTRDLSISDKPLSYRYLHFAFTHFPVDFDEQCTYRSDDRRWFDANQNEPGLQNETRCALSKMGKFLQALRNLEVYDQSLVVFKSDHGHFTSYFADEPYNLEINKHNLMGYSRYRPLLMIKPARAVQDGLVRRTDLVLLNDLAKTICLYGEGDVASSDCENFGGIDLLKTDNEDAGYFLYVVQTRASAYTFDSHFAAPIDSRLIEPLEALSAIDGITLTASGDSNE